MGADAEQVNASLDAAALAGLRRDGLLRPHSTTAWIELPEFASADGNPEKLVAVIARARQWISSETAPFHRR